jgi:hypothetical protein
MERFMNRLTIEMDTQNNPRVKIEKEIPMNRLTLEERISTAQLDRMTLLESLVILNEYMEDEFGMSTIESLDNQIEYLKRIRHMCSSGKIGSYPIRIVETCNKSSDGKKS